MGKARPLLQSYLERVSSTVFSGFPVQLTELVGSRHGIYALYKKDRLYYIGLASNLKRRIKHHLRDRHSGKWDRFSIYLVRKSDHIKELESLILRVADPKGNTVGGKLPRVENLQRTLNTAVKLEQERRRIELFGSEARRPAKSRTRKGSLNRTSKKVIKQRTRRSAMTSSEPALAPYVSGQFRIKGEYKGIVFRAGVNKSGTIRFKGFLYDSPSGAAGAARKLRTNGWRFWRYKNSKGEWVKLAELRKRRRK